MFELSRLGIYRVHVIDADSLDVGLLDLHLVI